MPVRQRSLMPSVARKRDRQRREAEERARIEAEARAKAEAEAARKAEEDERQRREAEAAKPAETAETAKPDTEQTASVADKVASASPESAEAAPAARPLRDMRKPPSLDDLAKPEPAPEKTGGKSRRGKGRGNRQDRAQGNGPPRRQQALTRSWRVPLRKTTLRAVVVRAPRRFRPHRSLPRAPTIGAKAA